VGSDFFKFKQFTVHQGKSSFRVGTDGVLLGAYAFAENAKTILDIGTGTGLIAMMLAQRSDASIFAIEPDDDSFKQACENVNLTNWNKRITIQCVNLQTFCRETQKFDLIVTNPPYFSNSLKNPDPRISAARHNDLLSPEELLTGVTGLLNENGIFQLILPYVEGNVFIAIAGSFGLYCTDILKIRPMPTSEIKRMILTFSKTRLNVTEKFLTIEHGKRHDFTDEYIALTKDFYLKF
jgi:tRNA1Val (adenine37-N6)-methyltransferase